MYALFIFRRKSVWAAASVLLLVCVIAAFMRRELLAEQLSAFFTGLTDASARSEMDITFTALLFAVVLSVCFFMFEIVWKRHWLPYAVVTGLMAAGPFFGIRPGVVPVFLGLVFQILFWTMHTAGRRSSRLRFAKKGAGKSRLMAQCCMFMGVVLSILICVSAVITAVWGAELSDIIYRGEGVVSRSMERLTGRAKDPSADGAVSTGNNYRTGETQLEVTLLEQPEDTLYLKGFTGGAYVGGTWEPADDAELFHEMAVLLDWEEWESWIGRMYGSLYFAMNEISSEEPSEPRTVFIRHANGVYETLYAPYYMRWIAWEDSSGPGYAFQYYEESELNIDWENVPEDFETGRTWFRQIQDAYMQVIPDAYTDVPRELLPRLSELCREDSFDSPDEVTAFILASLKTHASYTLTPGRAPLNEDIVEYFLFDNHEGCCVHFASAATLMYRLFQIPARYASGYAIQPSDFVQQEDGTWSAEVTDEYAHAWTEIFLEDYGWTPVEVTPSSDGSYHMSYPGLDTEALETMISQMAPRLTGGAGEDAANGGTGQTGESGGDFFSFSFDIDIDMDMDMDRYHDVFVAAAAVFIETLLLLPLFLDYRRLCRRRKLERMNCREIFGRFMGMLHSAGYMSGYNGTEDEFAGKLAEEISCLDRKEAERFAEIVSRAAYSREAPGEEDEEFVRKIYFRTEKWIVNSI